MRRLVLLVVATLRWEAALCRYLHVGTSLFLYWTCVRLDIASSGFCFAWVELLRPGGASFEAPYFVSMTDTQTQRDLFPLQRGPVLLDFLRGYVAKPSGSQRRRYGRMVRA